MRQADVAATLALLLASGVYAVPARNANIHAVQLGSNGSSLPSQQQGLQGNEQQDNDKGASQDENSPVGGAAGGNVLQGGATSAAVGLVALPGQQLTTGGLQPLPGAVTASVIESSAAVVETSAAAETSAAVETSAALGEVASDVSSSYQLITTRAQRIRLT